jgi:hypothetical protein
VKASRATPAGSRAAPARAQGDSLITLFSVQFRHSYYNASDDRCPDFCVAPTADCAVLMTSLGMIFKDQGVGFSVVIPRSRVGAMAHTIAQDFCNKAEGYGFWTRLSFLLLLKNPQFLGITALPIDAVPTEVNLFASNLQTTQSADGLVLGTGSALGPEALYPVAGPALPLPAAATGLVIVRDISGAPVCSTDASSPAPPSLAGQPFDYYTISIGGAQAAQPLAVLYAPKAAQTMGLLDLLLTQPTAETGDPKAFPVPPPSSGANADAPRTVELILNFNARSTFLNYYIVSQSPSGPFSDTLEITGVGTTFQQSQVQLCDGQPAVLFKAHMPLPLRQRPSHTFKLSGQRQGPSGGRDDICVDCLPTAPATPVWPAASGDALTGRSEIYVYV